MLLKVAVAALAVITVLAVLLWAAIKIEHRLFDDRDE